MRFEAPIQRDESESITTFISRCECYLTFFKQILYNSIKADKLSSRKEALFYQPNIKWTIPSPEYNINSILITYINALQCYYDFHSDKCYYASPKNIRCPNTVTGINTVIRTLEYGSLDMLPLFWLRPAYTILIEYKNNTINKNK